MKKIALALALLLIFSLLASCNEGDDTPEVTTTVTTTAVTTTTVVQQNKYTDCKVYASVDEGWEEMFAGRTYYKNTVQDVKNVTLGGKNFPLEYDCSIDSQYAFLDNIDEYTYYDASLQLWSFYTARMYVNSQTGKIVYFEQSLGTDYVEEMLAKGKTKYDKEECVSVAEDLIKEVVGDMLDYKLVNVYTSGDSYKYIFSREREGIDRYEPITVEVSVFKELIGYDISRVGEMSGAESLSEEDLAEIEKSVEKKLRERLESKHPGYTDDPEFKVEISRSEIYRFTDGRSVIKYTVKYERPPFPEQSIAETQKGSMTFYACLD